MNADHRDLVAIILAIGLSLALVLLMVGVLWDAVRSDTPGISDNAAQVIELGFGGIIGIIGSFLGYKAGASAGKEARDEQRNESSNRGGGGVDQ